MSERPRWTTGAAVDHVPLSEEEQEACAVMVACMRRGIRLLPPTNTGHTGWFVGVGPVGGSRYHQAPTPSEAYARALAAMAEEVEGE